MNFFVYLFLADAIAIVGNFVAYYTKNCQTIFHCFYKTLKIITHRLSSSLRIMQAIYTSVAALASCTPGFSAQMQLNFRHR